MDLLRLELNPALVVSPPATTLHRVSILGPDGKETFVYFRRNQRRARLETDGDFCMTKDETGVEFVENRKPNGTPVAVSRRKSSMGLAASVLGLGGSIAITSS